MIIESRKVPAVITASVLALLAPTALFVVNFPTLLNLVIGVGVLAAVILDRLDLRSQVRIANAASDEFMQKFKADVEAQAKAAADSVARPAYKNKDGETLQ